MKKFSFFLTEDFGVTSELIEESVEVAGKEVAESATKESAEILSKEIAESASEEALEEATEETTKKTLSETLKDGAKSLGEKVVDNPGKSLIAAGLVGTGVAALINKKSFGEQLGNEVKGGAKTVVNDVVKPIVKTTNKTITDFLKTTFGSAWKTIKWVLIVIGCLIVIGIIWKIINLIKGN
jgi:hypothetical protein